MSLHGELKHLFGAEVYAEAKASMRTPKTVELLKQLLKSSKQLHDLAGEIKAQREFVNSLPRDEKVALCRALIR